MPLLIHEIEKELQVTTQLTVEIQQSTYRKKLLSQMKPNVLTPKNTVCKWTITANSKITDTFTLSYSSTEEILVKEKSNGVTQTILPNSRRNLVDGKRSLATSTYSVSNADSITIFYHTTDVMFTTDFSASSTKSYLESEDSSDTSTIVLLIVVLSLTFVSLLLCAVITIIYRKCKIKQSNDAPENVDKDDTIHLKDKEYLYNPSNILYRINQEIKKLKSIVYNRETEGSNLTNCAICQDDYEYGEDLYLFPNCNHIFHKNCIVESIKLSSQSGSHRCPLCKTEIDS
jgi:hypothetical protein